MKKRDLIAILFIYVLAYAIGYVFYLFFNNDIIKLLMFDLAATFVVYLFGVLLKNSSVYDPYWSLTPFVMALLFLIDNSLFSFKNIIFLIVFGFWSFRLTINWMITFKNLKNQDWRYDMYKEKFPKLWPFINLTGINFMPTIVVFLSFIPSLSFMMENTFNPFTIIGLSFIVIGTIIEFFADHQMHLFQKNNTKKVCSYGLWKYSRHPNYYGEITVWFGVFLLAFLPNFKNIYLICGLILTILLFEFVSIPMMEKRQLQRRDDYIAYISKTSRLVPWPPRY